jgi:hypothetical protein
VPFDANGCINQIQQTSHEGDIVLCGPPLYGEHILDQPYSGEGPFLEGSRYEIDSFYHHAQSCLSANLVYVDEAVHSGVLFSGSNIVSTPSEEFERPFNTLTSGHFTLRSIDYPGLGDLLSYCTATQAPPLPPISPAVLPNYEAVNPVSVRDVLDEACGQSEACLGSCEDRADLEKSEPAVLAEE